MVVHLPDTFDANKMAGTKCGLIFGDEGWRADRDSVITDAEESDDVNCTRCRPELHPLQLGQHYAHGTVIAWGYFTDEILSVMLLVDAEFRVPNKENYAIGHIHLEDGKLPTVWIDGPQEPLHSIRYHANIIPAVEDDWRQNEQDY